jgi:hypothetical protein
MGILFERTLTEKGQDMPRVRPLLFLCLVGGFSYGTELHLHGGGLLSAAPCPNASIEVERLAVYTTLAGQTQA